MTTVVVDSVAGVVVADTQLSFEGYKCSVQKVFRLPDGGVASGAGTWRSVYAGIKWMMGGEVGDAPEIPDAVIVILRPDRTIWYADEGFPAYPVLDPKIAAGCGQDLARMCLSKGATALEAVEQACELDSLSSGPLQSMSIVTPEPLPGVDTHRVKRKK